MDPSLHKVCWLQTCAKCMQIHLYECVSASFIQSNYFDGNKLKKFAKYDKRGNLYLIDSSKSYKQVQSRIPPY